ncbi:hypothetical protein RUM44_001596 [Polyplax serrata]|uniref:Uncharacterized protein n=1 Tax=Polyplax serrata TaxID=468196 RepID=A0ABR1ALZ3_POLSC
MEDGTVKVKKKNKTGPLKSTPGFLKCMRNVYLYFKEEKEKGALNIPINSFIERTAVACGVGRKTLYNYAKKGLFDEHPIILQPKQKKKKAKKKLRAVEDCGLKKSKKKCSSPESNTMGTSTSFEMKKKPPSPNRIPKNAMIQTDPRPLNPAESIVIQSTSTNDSDGFSHFVIARDQKVQQVQLVTQPEKVREAMHILAGPWTSGSSTIKREVDYFPKNNVWHAVYNLHTTDAQNCSDLNSTRTATFQQQATSDHLPDL